MARRERRRQRRLIHVFCMASVASAASTSMSLSNFQLITSSSTPIACILAYNEPIMGCTTNDFTRGQSCSASCLQGLEKLQATLSSACAGISSRNTVLEQALSGQLVGLLCPASAQSVTSNSQTSTDDLPTTTSQDPVPNPTTKPPPEDTSLPAQPSTGATTNAPPSRSSSPPSPPLSSSSPSAPQPSQSQTTQSRPPASQSSGAPGQPSQSSGSGESADDPSIDSSGGGSPFDLTNAQALGSRHAIPSWFGLLVATTALTLLVR